MVFLQGSRRDLVSVRRKMLEKREEYSVACRITGGDLLTEVNLVLVVLVL